MEIQMEIRIGSVLRNMNSENAFGCLQQQQQS